MLAGTAGFEDGEENWFSYTSQSDAFVNVREEITGEPNSEKRTTTVNELSNVASVQGREGKDGRTVRIKFLQRFE